ncbi:MAG: EF-hand domain-containing protein [Planctomycetes bacterium]|nr:EF-hand domain-containing protein [Planctomycetota bacterium]
MSRANLVAVLAVALMGLSHAAARSSDAPQGDDAAKNELEARLKAEADNPTAPTGKSGKKGAKGEKGEKGAGKMGEGGGMYGRLLEQFDADHDKKLTGKERTDAIDFLMKTSNEKDIDLPPQVDEEQANKIKNMRKQMMERADENKDGKIDAKEAAKMLEQMEKMNSPEGLELRKKLMEKFDENHDGKLDEKEMAKAKEAMLARQGKRGPGGKGEGKKETETKSDDGINTMNDAERAKAQAELDKILNEK